MSLSAHRTLQPVIPLPGVALLLLATLFSGCATAPPAQEMSDARQSLEAARSVGAQQHAPEMVDSAQQLLSRAESDIQSGHYEQAQRDATAARAAAHRALAVAHSKLESAPESLEPPPQPAIPAEPLLPGHYVVEARDNLWQIAAKPAIYGDARLWPLLLKANAGIIERADLIRPGTTLQIERAPSAEEIESALRHSRSRGDGAPDASDRGYLRLHGLR